MCDAVPPLCPLPTTAQWSSYTTGPLKGPRHEGKIRRIPNQLTPRSSTKISWQNLIPSLFIRKATIEIAPLTPFSVKKNTSHIAWDVILAASHNILCGLFSGIYATWKGNSLQSMYDQKSVQLVFCKHKFIHKTFGIDKCTIFQAGGETEPTFCMPQGFYNFRSFDSTCVTRF